MAVELASVKLVIKVSDEFFVAGFSSRYMCVQITKIKNDAKEFKNKKAAENLLKNIVMLVTVLMVALYSWFN